MITSWADEEDKANVKYDSIRGKGKNNTCNNNNKDHRGRSSSNCKRKLDNTVAAIQRPTKDNSKKTSGGFKDLLRKSAHGIWMAITPSSSATSSDEHSRIHLTHGLLTTRRARRKSTKAMTTSRNPTRQ
jgi:hypothetical protein